MNRSETAKDPEEAVFVTDNWRLDVLLLFEWVAAETKNSYVTSL